MWGLVPAAFLVVGRRNIYLMSLLTTMTAVTYGQFILVAQPIALTPRLVYSYIVNQTYTVILALTLKAAGFGKQDS